MSSFEQFNLPKSLQKAIDEMGLTTPTPIQERSFPVIMSGRDVMGIAQTGTGKTYAYLLPILKQWKFTPTHTPKVVIIVPTRDIEASRRDQGVRQRLACIPDLFNSHGGAAGFRDARDHFQVETHV